MRKGTVSTWIFLMVIFSVGILNFCFHTNHAVSDQENRSLQTRPEISFKKYLSGEMTRETDAFVSDQFMQRKYLVQFSKNLSKYKGLPSKVQIQRKVGSDMVSEQSGKRQQDKSAPMVKEFKPEGSLKPVNTDLVIYEKGAFRVFRKNLAAEIAYIRAVTEFAILNPDFRVFLMIAPTQAAFLPKQYEDYTDNVKDSILRMGQAMDERVDFVSPVQILEQHQKEYLFFKTDHHWNGKGAYYAYVEFCMHVGLTPLPISALPMEEIPDFLGSHYTLTQNDTLLEHKDVIEAYKPKYAVQMENYYLRDGEVKGSKVFNYSVSEALMGKSPSYSVYLGGDNANTVIRTKSDQVNGKILLVKDSYGNAFSTYLSNHYEEVHLIDPRYWQGSIREYMQANGIESVLFLNNVEITMYEGFDSVLRQIF